MLKFKTEIPTGTITAFRLHLYRCFADEGLRTGALRTYAIKDTDIWFAGSPDECQRQISVINDTHGK